MCGDSLITEVAGIGEGLQLNGRLCDWMPNLCLNNGPFNVLLQVDKSTVVAQRLSGWDVWVLEEIRVSHSVSTHNIVHVHTDGVADFGRQRGCGGERAGPTLPGKVPVFGKLENDTLKTNCTISLNNNRPDKLFTWPSCWVRTLASTHSVKTYVLF